MRSSTPELARLQYPPAVAYHSGHRLCPTMHRAGREQLYGDSHNSEGARSPITRDRVRRRVGAGLYETAQVLYMYTTSAVHELKLQTVLMGQFVSKW